MKHVEITSHEESRREAAAIFILCHYDTIILYSRTSRKRRPKGPEKVSAYGRCPLAEVQHYCIVTHNLDF